MILARLGKTRGPSSLTLLLCQGTSLPKIHLVHLCSFRVNLLDNYIYFLSHGPHKMLAIRARGYKRPASQEQLNHLTFRSVYLLV